MGFCSSVAVPPLNGEEFRGNPLRDHWEGQKILIWLARQTETKRIEDAIAIWYMTSEGLPIVSLHRRLCGDRQAKRYRRRWRSCCSIWTGSRHQRTQRSSHETCCSRESTRLTIRCAKKIPLHVWGNEFLICCGNKQALSSFRVVINRSAFKSPLSAKETNVNSASSVSRVFRRR
jgi:hypothetical protein